MNQCVHNVPECTDFEKLFAGSLEDISASNGLGRRSLSDLSVLLAEDCPNTAEVLAFMLEGMGMRVSRVLNGVDCVMKAWEAHEAGKPYDVLLVDMQLPYLHGFDVSRALRERNYHRPMVAITASPSLSKRSEGLHAGYDAVLAKSELRHTMLATLSCLL